MRPVEGTILTVVREASEARRGRRGRRGATWSPCSRRLARRARDALARTPEMLPVLEEAGVVDAGGTGFLLLLDVLLHVVDGRPVPEPTEVDGPVVHRAAPGRMPTAWRARRRLRPALRGHVLPRGARRGDPGVQGRVGRHRRLDRGGRRRRPLELPHPHRRHRRLDRGRHRHRHARARSGSPTCSSRSRRSAGSARPSRPPSEVPAARHARRSPAPSSRSPPATASGGSSTRSACRASSPAARR